MFEPVAELRIGPIVEVRGDKLRIELDAGLDELTRIHEGLTYPIGQVGSVIKVLWGRRVLLAHVSLLRMRSEIPDLEAHRNLGLSDDSRILEAELFAEGQWSVGRKSFRFDRGVRRYPMPRQDAFLLTRDEHEAMLRGAERRRRSGENDAPNGADSDVQTTSSFVQIGHYVGTGQSPCFADLDKLFGLHGAVLGSTGSGKSGTVAAILHSVLEISERKEVESFSPRIVLLDPHGEYASAFGDRAVVYQPGPIANPSPSRQELKLPYWTMSGEELRDLIIGKTEHEATSENNIVMKALRHARLVERGWIEEARDWVGQAENAVTFPDEPRPLPGHEGDFSSYNRDLPDRFDLEEFKRHIEQEQGINVDSRKKIWAKKSSSKFEPHYKVLDKLNFLRTDPRLSFLMQLQGQLDLPGVLEQFVGDAGEDRPIRIVDMSTLPNEVAGPLTAALARTLFQYKVWQTTEERKRDPVLLVCEEAHRYVPDSGLAEYGSAQSAIRRIAKEGRKYGIGLLLVSQRPGDVEKTVLSQCNSWIVLRLTNSSDQDQVRRFLPDNLSGLTNLLPSLARREALFVGEAAAFPSRIEIRQLREDQLPDAHDVPFVTGWCGQPTQQSELEPVIQRWRREEEHEPPIEM